MYNRTFSLFLLIAIALAPVGLLVAHGGGGHHGAHHGVHHSGHGHYGRDAGYHHHYHYGDRGFYNGAPGAGGVYVEPPVYPYPYPYQTVPVQPGS